VLRRTDLAFQGLVTAELVDELADVVGSSLGWTPEQRAEEIAVARETLTTLHGLSFTESSATLTR
jgi:glycerol-3-phosphate dehydrogenase